MIGLFLFFTFAASQASSQSQVLDRNEVFLHTFLVLFNSLIIFF